MIDLDAIKGRANSAYLLDRDDGDALFAAMGDVKTLLAEVERLREECHTLRLWAEEAARAENANAEDAKRERERAVAWLRKEMQPCSGPVRGTLAYAANEIERGEHRREGTK